MQFNYIVEDAGWATANFACGDSHVEVTASYLHDSLRDIALAVLAVIDGASESSALFMDEPGEHVVTFRRISDEDVDVDITWYSVWKSLDVESRPGRSVLQCRTNVQHLRRQVQSALGRVLESHGLEGYRAKWGMHDFPQKEYNALIRSAHAHSNRDSQ